jgi:thioredoxin 1
VLTILNSENFNETVLESDIPVVVDFFASWCGPCKMLAPIMEQIAQEFDGSVLMCKIDIDENSNIAQKYNIMSVPTLIFFKNGETVHTESGFSTYEQLCNIIKTTFLL